MIKTPEISIVSPVYAAENIIDELIHRIEEEVIKITQDYEIILVEDCSQDNSWARIVENCNRNHKVKGIKLSRNFGQHNAISAGIAKARGDNIILMDCDLQDDPREIPRLVAKRNEGYDIVYTKRMQRKHGFIKSLSSYLYSSLFSLLADGKYDIDAGSFVIFSKRVAAEFNQLNDIDRLYLQMLKWIGFKSTVIEIEHKPRFEGKSTYNFFKLLNLAINGLISHSYKLLQFSIYLGMLFSAASFVLGLIIFIKFLFYEFQPGWPSIILTILFSTGIILFAIGILGIYIGKTFEQTKNRPLYIVDQEINIS